MNISKVRQCISRSFAYLIVTWVTVPALASAEVLENTCVCQGYGINGEQPSDAPQFSYIPDNGQTNLASARNEAIHDCRMGFNRGNGSLCTPAACPAGTIDTTPMETLPASRGSIQVSKIIRCDTDQGDITRTWDRGWQLHTPAAAGCSLLANGKFQCSVQCIVVRQCAL